jgi:hypothetical protein
MVGYPAQATSSHSIKNARRPIWLPYRELYQGQAAYEITALEGKARYAP